MKYAYIISQLSIALLVLSAWLASTLSERHRIRRLLNRQWLGIRTGLLHGDEWPGLMPRTHKLTVHYRYNAFLFISRIKTRKRYV